MSTINWRLPAARAGTQRRQPEKAAAAFGAIEESHRRLVVRLVFAIYTLMLFEGILRKWILPQWGRHLYFIRDPFVLAIYILVVSKRTRFRTGFLEMGCLFGVAGLILTIGGRILSTGEITPVFISAYGWRNYFLYLPLAFIIGRYLDLRDLRRLLAATSLISVAMAVLAVAQFGSSPWAPINSGSGDTPEEYYTNQGLPGGFVRPFGTFTSNQGMSTFAVSAVTAAIFLWLTLSRSRSLRSCLLLACATAGSSACLALSGSRTAFVWSGLVIVLLIPGVSLAPGGLGPRAAAITFVLILLGAVTAPVLFPEATWAFITRWSEAGESEERVYGSGGIWGRAVYEVFSFRLLLSDTPSQGYGLGSAGNAASKLGREITFTDSAQVGAAESDWGRNVVELGPIFGCLFILYRIALTIWLAKEALVATRRSGHPLPWLLFAFVGILIFNGQITGNGTTNAYAWLFTGCCLAAANRVAAVPQRRLWKNENRSATCTPLMVSG
jgi:hypothetical protein